MNVKVTPYKIENDSGYCTVVALTNVTGWDFKKCWYVANNAGRKRHNGFMPHVLLEYASKHHGLEFELVKLKYNPTEHLRRRRRYGYDELTPVYKSNSPTLAQFVKQHPTGRFYISTIGHSLAVVNGVVMDAWKIGPRRRVKRAWRIHERSIY